MVLVTWEQVTPLLQVSDLSFGTAHEGSRLGHSRSAEASPAVWGACGEALGV